MAASVDVSGRTEAIRPSQSGPDAAPTSRSRFLLLALGCGLGGLAVALAFPPYGLIWLLPVGLAVPMAVVVATRPSGRAGFGYGFAFGLGFLLMLLNWNRIVGYDAWIVLSAFEALFYGLLGLSWAWLRSYRWWPLGFAVTWVGAEYLRGTVPFGGLPWGWLAFALPGTPFARYGRVGGTALVAFVAVLAVALAVAAVFTALRGRRWPALVAAGCAAALVLASGALPATAAGPDGHVRVAAVQGDVPGSGLQPFAQRWAVLDNHANATIDFARKVAAGEAARPDLVIWPENSTDIDPFADRRAYNKINRAVRAVGVPTLVGAVVDGPDPEHVENMGIVWSPRTGPGAFYVKRHPVPFGEYIPFRSILTKFIKRLQDIPKDFYAGKRPGVLKVGPVTLGDVICFEVAYDGLVRDVIEGGGRFLVVQTNNATWARTYPGQLSQQFAISRYRAIETGRTVVIASTDGISGIIAPDGQVLQQAAPRIRKVLDARIETAAGVTPGVRYGFALEVLLATLALVGTAGAGSHRLIRSRTPVPGPPSGTIGP